MTTCARRQEPCLALPGWEMSKPASKQASKTPLLLLLRACIKRAGERALGVQSSHMAAGLLVASAGFQRPGSFFVHTHPAALPRDYDVNNTTTALYISYLAVTNTSLTRLHIQTNTQHPLPAIP